MYAIWRLQATSYKALPGRRMRNFSSS
uniref:Uncharacterized protein n=1 Tax=Rhizophora mucronata TaxID=61149 RepID=A0A2P2LS65_RHIMU